ncbi:hypothetical protein DdX_18812 [Ditylenchus destructor]|uniref:Uncharacterized protein n=1 Tax=Ditylenchus destructor TaxID=166010 RepID=A0AAD4MNS9_9BILA|nr:hypothetical protein DdX_18812 [Ditylenchus destructor]
MQPYKRPRLNVESNFLIYFKGAPPKQSYPELKRAANRVIGKMLREQTDGELLFIETFEGWYHRPTTHLLLEFDSEKSMNAFHVFIRKAESWGFNGSYIVLNPNDRGEFFRKVQQYTRVDLIACNGIPPGKPDNHKLYTSKRR